MTTPRRVIESNSGGRTLDAGAERLARKSGVDLPNQREAHVQSMVPRTSPSALRASRLESLSARLASDENLARELQKDPRRALSRIDFLTDSDKHHLGAIGPAVWSKLAEAAQNYQVAVGARALAGLPPAATTPGVYNPQNGGAYGFGDFSALIGAGSRPSPGSPWRGPSGPDTSAFGRGSDADGSPGFAGFGGSSLPRGVLPDDSDRGIDTNYRPGAPVTLPGRPAPTPGSEKEATVEGWDYPAQFDPKVGKAWDDAQMNKAGRDAQLAEKTRAQETLEREAAEQAAQDELFSPTAAGKPPPQAPEPVRVVLLKKDEAPPPPKHDGSNPNLEGTGGTGPGGPRAREAASAFGREITPNLEGTGRGGPIGPRSVSADRGVYTRLGREAIPNDEGTGRRGPVGPRSRESSLAERALFRGDFLPDPDAIGTGGSVGPRS